MDKLLITKHPPALSSPLYVLGLSGQSEFGRVATRMLINRTGAELFAEYYSNHFPDHVIITEDGTCRPLRYEFYESSLSSPHLLVANGDDGITLENPESGYEVLDELVALGITCAASSLILVDAIQTDSDNSVYVSATKSSILRNLERKGAKVLRDTRLLGQAGIILGICRFHSLSAVGIFPTISPKDNLEAKADATLKFIENSFKLRYPAQEPS